MENKNKTGALPSQCIRKMIANEEIQNASKKNIQPASIDLTVSNEGYRMKGTFLPRKNETVRDIIKSESLYQINLNNPLEKNGVYFVRLNEKLNLLSNIFALSSPKSSIGRVDLQARLVIDKCSRFDNIPPNYKGEIWLQVIPKSFLIKLNFGDKLNQIRFFNGEAGLDHGQFEKSYNKYRFLFDESLNFMPLKSELEKNNGNSIAMSIDLDSAKKNSIVGYKNLLVDQVLDLSKRNYYNPEDFFEPIYASKDGKLILEKGSFYIFSTKEFIRVPKEFAAEMAAYDISNGEFRSHYAGFFDPGFGYGDGGQIKGRQAVLELRSYDSNFIFRDGQPICKISYEKLTDTPDFVYGGEEAGSHYADQSGPKLSKHFRR